MRSSTPCDWIPRIARVRKKLFSRAFYWIFTSIDGDSARARQRRLPADVASAGRCPQSTARAPSVYPRARALVGVPADQRAVSCPARWAGRPKYTFRRSLRLALEGVTAFSLFPLRFVTVFGLIVMAASFVYGALCLVLATARRTDRSGGWTSLMICVQFFGGCQLATIGILSEYLGRTWTR